LCTLGKNGELSSFSYSEIESQLMKGLTIVGQHSLLC